MQALSFVPIQGSQMIYATQVSWIPAVRGVPFPAGKYNSEVHVRRLAILCLLLSGIPASGQVDGPWRAAPGYLALFAPADGRIAAYRAYVSPLGLDMALRRLEANSSLIRAPGAWQARPLPPADAFGQTGRYDRWALARLYGAQQPQVARGSRAEGGRVIESWTLISPYPDTALRRLETGTLLVVLRLP